MDISDFYETFFEEAEELLADMERLLLDLDVDDPDIEDLNAIFRAAHSIKGGAGTFGFTVLQETTHRLENLLDHTRRGELKLRRDIVDTFLETKDMLHDQLDAYRNGSEPDAEAFERISRVLQQMALEELGQGGADDAPPPAAAEPAPVEVAASESAAPEPVAQASEPQDAGDRQLAITLNGVNEKDRELLVEELQHFGKIVSRSGDQACYSVVLASDESRDDIEAVLCFIIEPDQLSITDVVASPADDAPAASGNESAGSDESAPESMAGESVAGESTAAERAVHGDAEDDIAQPGPLANDANTASGAAASPAKPAAKSAAKNGGKGGKNAESSTIRVPVDKVDQIINLVGELIITQSMLEQTANDMDIVSHGPLVNGMNLLQRNARDLQESVMSIRMMPMDYVFSRFPRLVRDLAAKLGKDVELVTEGKSTELDKSLIERIIDPLTHLVRNSLDHGLESPERRIEAGKSATGRLTLSAQHQGGNILIEVIDDGAGLNRERILAKAKSSGLPVSDTMSDDDVWQLIFAPGFSTAEQVSDVSGRGVGMDVVKRNIQEMGGHVEILSQPGNGTTTRIVLPLTLAILDGMSIRCGAETFLLPLNAVLESLQPQAEEIYSMAGDDQLLKVRDEYLPIISLHHALDVVGAKTEVTESIAVIVQGEGRRYALLVDDLIGQQQVVVKNLETNYRKVPGISAATILGDGSVALILDIADLHRLDRRKSQQRHESKRHHLQEVSPA
ncbi:chemotaxis protein CheA [Salinicola rhizosphaerae]|uniref:Chemotaxis protein CheA n=1 Tax=Salinicola rhizosphaerae TaxID=1443141 RepID=A0ABQ3DRX8_9GAMM|nr:chemotaxis protein CheA [Salinicola rhizosphaerae]GHB10240.1 chemotaxis protein CheA [Salinicola rhizosphaerae]